MRQKRPKLLIRRVVGSSMEPALGRGKTVVGTGLYKNLKVGDIIVFKHGGLEKIKRISQIDDGHIYVLGDNPGSSTDSRTFGWISVGHVLGKIIWPKA